MTHSTHAVRQLATVLFALLLTTSSIATVVTLAATPAAATSHVPLGTPGLGPTDSSDFTTEVVVDGLTQPMSFAFLPDGRMLVVQKTGDVVITDPTTSDLSWQTYMTLDVSADGQQGLQDIVIDPDFLQNGYFYVFYQTADPVISRVSRFQHVENSGGFSSRGDRSSETVIWEDPEAVVGVNQVNGALEFGPDGLLYLTYGEEKLGTPAQDLSDAGGKVHRFTADGTVPADNPFVDDAEALDSIWAYGLRNPHRAQWDLPTERFFIADVGENSYEEVNLGQRGANYGWPNCEGPCSDPQYTDPLYSYPHRTDGGSIIGGPVYRGDQYPSEYTGAYFFADFIFNEIRYLTFDDTGAVTGDYLFTTLGGRPSDLQEGPDGALYSVRWAYNDIRRTEYRFATDAPYITGAGADVTSGPAPLTVEFQGFASDPDGQSLTYTWEFGDGTTGSGETTSHTYTSSGVFEARLRVTDASGNEDVSDPIEITVGAGPSVHIDTPADGSTFVAGDVITFSGSATDSSGAPIPSSDLSWTVEFIHNTHTHPELGPVSGSSGSFEISRTGHDYSSNTGYRLSLTATDANGISATEHVDIFPEKVDLTLASSPSGIDLSLDGVPHTAPYVHDTLVGFDHTVTAPESVCVAGTTYEFDSWSDGGTRSHVYRVPSTDATLTATYTATDSCSAGTIPTAGLAVHYAGDQGLTVSNGAVTGWADQSENGNDLTTSGGPTVTTSPSGAQAVRFDGVDDLASRTGGLTAVPTGNSDRTMFVVANYRGTGYGGVAYGSPSLNKAYGLVVTPDGDLMVQGWGGANDYPSGVPGTGAGWQVDSVVHENGALTHYLDGSAIDTGTHAYQTSANRIVVGAEMTPAPYIDMDLAAVLVYNRALSATERQEVEAVLRQTYLDGTAPPAEASVSITAPADGATITGSDLTVSWDGVAATSGDHVHLSLDGGAPVEDLPLSGSYTFTGVAAGGHTVTATVADSSHVAYTNPEATDSVTVTLEEATTNSAPVANDDSASVTQGESVTVDVLANDADAENDIDPTTVQVTQYPASGTVVVDAVTGAIEYTHDGSASTSDSFAYTVADSTGNVSNEATVSVSITSAPPSSDLPVTSGLALHFDSLAGVTTSGSTVTGWADQSGNGNDLSTSGGPTLATNPAGVSVVRFDGVDDLASRTGGLTGVPTENSDRTMFVVADYRGTGYGGVAYGSPALNKAYGLVVTPDGDLMVQGWGGANDYPSGVAGTGAGWQVDSVVHENSAFTHYLDGSVIDTGTHTYQTTANRLVVGAEMTPAPYIDMDLAAVVIYDRALTETERQQVEAYLHQRYVDGTSPPPAEASVSITSPADGASLTGSDLTVSWDGVEAASGDHVHLSLDGGAPVEDLPLSGTYTFSGVAEGGHTVTVTVVDSNHAAYTNPEATDSVSVTLEAESTNSAPVANDDSASVTQDESVTVDVLANDADADGDLDPTTVQVTQYPASGTVIVDAVTGAIEYTHDGSASTSDSFAYTVDDDAGATSNAATVSVSVTSAPPPSDLPVTSGLALHFDSLAGVTTSGSTVTGWADQSGNGNDLSTSGGPTLATNPAGAQVVRFDGVDDLASRTGGLAGVPTGNSDRTMFVVAEYRGTGYGGVAYGSPSLNQAYGLVVTPDGDLMVQGWGGANDYPSGVAGTGAGWQVDSVVHENSAFTHYLDGNVIDTGTHTYQTSANQIVLGAEMTPAPYVDMDVAAVVVYDRALSATEHQQVEAYLDQRYVDGTAPPPAEASVSITSPTDGATITGTDLTVSWDGTEATSGDHVHLSLDDGPVEDLPLSGTYTFTGVSAGEYTVTATVADSSHVAYTNPEATDSVTVTLDAGTTPSDLPVTSGLALHLDSLAGVTTSGSTVTGWADQSGNGNDLSTSGGPTLATNPAGVQVIRFDGVDDLASRTGGLTGVPTGNSDRTMFVVANYRGTGYGGVAYGSPSLNQAYGLVVTPDGDLMVQGWGGANDYPSGVAGTGAGWQVDSVVHESSAFTHYLDGSVIDSGTHTYQTSANQIVLGAEMTPAPYIDMDVAAVVIYDRALTETERQQVEAYLQQRYT